MRIFVEFIMFFNTTRNLSMTTEHPSLPTGQNYTPQIKRKYNQLNVNDDFSYTYLLQ